MMQRTANENAACLCRICKRFHQPKIERTVNNDARLILRRIGILIHQNFPDLTICNKLDINLSKNLCQLSPFWTFTKCGDFIAWTEVQ